MFHNVLVHTASEFKETDIENKSDFLWIGA